MINIKNKKDCCGCEACVQCCPKSCIIMQEDREGFLYPKVNEDDCANCGLCERVCPVINQTEERTPILVYAAKHKNERIRLESSSGGVFTAIAECVIEDGGVVFGAKFDKTWSVVHGYTETKEGLSAFRGSKYVQSRIGDSYKDVELFLKGGRQVLFSGTPCQIAGLKGYLHKDYSNLLTVDFICHGVPSPRVWHEYLRNVVVCKYGDRNTTWSQDAVKEKCVRLESISFRDKKLGWKKFSFSYTLSVPDEQGNCSIISQSEPLNKNVFLRGFWANLYLRPSCHACPVKCFKSGSDITIGDFWGVQKIMAQIDDDKGLSVIMLNSMNAERCINTSMIEKWPLIFDIVLNYNHAIKSSAKMPRKRDVFFRNDGKSLEEKVHELSKVSILNRLKQKINSILR